MDDTDFSDSEKESSAGVASNALFRYNAYWTKDRGAATFATNTNIGFWINGWGRDYPSSLEQEEFFKDSGEPKPCEMVRFLRHHPEHRIGWNVALHRKLLLSTIGLETLPLLLLNVLCLAGTLVAVWNKTCYHQLR